MNLFQSVLKKNKLQVLELRRTRQEISQLSNTVKKIEPNLLLAKREHKSCQQTLAKTQAVLKQTRNDFSELIHAFEAKVDAEMQGRLDARTLPWLLQAKALQISLKNTAGSDLLARAS